jgi:hypothetical protein
LIFPQASLKSEACVVYLATVGDYKKWAYGLVFGSVSIFGSMAELAAEGTVESNSYEIWLDLERVVPQSLGAVPAAPWLVRVSSVNVRNAPMVIGRSIVGVVKKEKC